MDFILPTNGQTETPTEDTNTATPVVNDLSWKTRIKLETNLNYSNMVSSVSEEQLNFARKRSVRDPLSHRIIEKKRRDRMNSCLANLSSLLPPSYWKKSRGRIEKTEIIEMAITHMKYLQLQINMSRSKQNDNSSEINDSSSDAFYFGYQECMAEIMHFLVEVEGYYPADNLCTRLLTHLRKHGEKVTKHYTKSQESFFIPHDRNEIDDSKIPIFKKVEDTSSSSTLSQQFLMETKGNDKSGETAQISAVTADFIESTSAQHLQENGTPFALKESVPVPQPQTCDQPIMSCPATEEIYKYKTRIKHRFNADLQFYKQTENKFSLQNGIQAN